MDYKFWLQLKNVSRPHKVSLRVTICPFTDLKCLDKEVNYSLVVPVTILYSKNIQQCLNRYFLVDKTFREVPYLGY